MNTGVKQKADANTIENKECIVSKQMQTHKPSNNGRLCIGLPTLKFIYGFPKAVKSKGAVSPATRATASMAPDNIPLNPHGTMILKITL